MTWKDCKLLRQLPSSGGVHHASRLKAAFGRMIGREGRAGGGGVTIRRGMAYLNSLGDEYTTTVAGEGKDQRMKEIFIVVKRAGIRESKARQIAKNPFLSVISDKNSENIKSVSYN